MADVAQGVLAVSLLSVAVLAVGWCGLYVWDRMEECETTWTRLPWFLAALLLIVLGFGLVVEWRCLIGWIDESECHVWD